VCSRGHCRQPGDRDDQRQPLRRQHGRQRRRHFNSGTATLAGGALRDNTAYGSGGGIENIGRLTALGVSFQGNAAAAFGGGIHTFGGFYAYSGALAVVGSSFRGNSAASGGGIAVNYASATIVDSTFRKNVAMTDGGGLYVKPSSSVLIDGSLIIDKTRGACPNLAGPAKIRNSRVGVGVYDGLGPHDGYYFASCA
jgi:hypothetical protein